MGYLTDTRFDIVMSNYVAKVREAPNANMT